MRLDPGHQVLSPQLRLPFLAVCSTEPIIKAGMPADRTTSGREYFEPANSGRTRQIRTPELHLWIACLDTAMINARLLARGEVIETSSRDPRRIRWELAKEVDELRAWMRSCEKGGRLWIGSVIEACLGSEAFDGTRFDKDLRALLSRAEDCIERLRQRILSDALSRPSSLSDSPVPRQDQGSARVLPRSSRQNQEAVAARRIRPRRQAMAQTQGTDTSQGRLALSV